MPTIEPLKQASGATAQGGARLALFLTVFFDLLGFGIVIPFLPMYAERLGVGAAGVGLLLAIYSMMQLICAPMLGRISDRVGRRPIIMLGLAGSSAGYLIYGFADSFGWLLFSRALHGVCAATVPTAQAYIADTTSEEERAHGMGMIGAAFGLGFVLGPALGGMLGHTSLRTPVFLASALTFANLLFAYAWLPESHPPEPGLRLKFAWLAAPLVKLPRDLARHHLARLFATAFLVTFALAALEATFALMIPQRYGYGAFGVGALLAFAGLIQALAQGYLVGRMARRIGEARLLRIGLVALVVGLGPLASAGSRATMCALLALLSLGYGLSSPSIASLISKSTVRHLQGEVLGVNQSALSLARIFGPLAGGLAYDWFGPAAPYVGGAAAAVFALMLATALDGGGI
jgi:MFS transporter, DHA1 family, tetracycline resistance protein